MLFRSAGAQDYDCVIGAVAHRLYADFDGSTLAAMLKPTGIVADVKGMWRRVALPDQLTRWQL